MPHGHFEAGGRIGVVGWGVHLVGAIFCMNRMILNSAYNKTEVIMMNYKVKKLYIDNRGRRTRSYTK